MTATRVIDDHTELVNIGTNSHAQLDTHVSAANDYVKRDGSLSLTADWDIGNGIKILADHIRARDGDGLKLCDDGGNGIFVKDGGWVGIGTTTPLQNFEVHATTGNVYLQLYTLARATAGMVFRNSTRSWTFKMDLNGKFVIRDITGGRNNLNIDTSGNFGFNIYTPTAMVDINSDILRLRTAKTPATAGAAGNQGDICWDANYIYVCTATNTWKRSALSSW